MYLANLYLPEYKNNSLHYNDYINVTLAKYSKVKEQKKVCKVCDFTHIHQNVSTCLPVCKLWENCCFSQTKPEIGALVSEKVSGEGVNIRRG